MAINKMFEALLWLFALLAGVYLTILYEQKRISGRTVAILTCSCGAALLLTYLTGFFSWISILIAVVIVGGIGAISVVGRRPVAPDLFYRHRDFPSFVESRFSLPSTADVANITKRLRLPSGEHFINLRTRPMVRQPSDSSDGRSGNGRACVFAKMKPRLYLPWLDAAYYILLRDLKKCGCRPVIYLYDFDFRLVDSTVPEVPVKTDLNAMVRNTRTYIQHLVGSGTVILQGTQYFRRRRPAQQLHDFLYSEVFPRIALQTVRWSESPAKSDEVRARELLFQLHGYPTILVAKLLAKHQPVYALQWEGRADKWDMTEVDRNIQVLVSTTLKARHRPLRILESIHLTDDERTIRDKLGHAEKYGGDEELRLMCALLLYRQELNRYDWKTFLSNASIQEITATTRLLVDDGFLNRADTQSIAMAVTVLNGSPNREALASSEALTSAFLQRAVFDGIKAFQTEYGLRPYVIA